MYCPSTEQASARLCQVTKLDIARDQTRYLFLAKADDAGLRHNI